MPQELRFVSL